MNVEIQGKKKGKKAKRNQRTNSRILRSASWFGAQ